MKLSDMRFNMRFNMRFCIACIAAVLLAFGIPAMVQAEALQVMDLAGLLEEEEIVSLTEEIGRLEASTGWDVITATTSDAGGEDATTYAELLFDQNCVCDDGIICLIDMDNREIVLRTFGKAIYYVTDNRRDDILDEAYERISDGEYKACLTAMVEGVGEAYEHGIPRDQYTYDEDTGEIVRYREPRRITLLEALVAVAAAVAAGGLTAGAVIGKYRLKWGGYQYSFRENGNVALEVKKDTLVNQVVTHRRIPKEPPKSSGSGGSRSTVHTGGGGRTSGGGSRKF